MNRYFAFEVRERKFEFLVTRYIPECPPYTGGEADNWDPGYPAEIEFEMYENGKRADAFQLSMTIFELSEVEAKLIKLIKEEEANYDG